MMVLLVTAHTMVMIFIVLMSVTLTITRLLLFFTTRQKSNIYCIFRVACPATPTLALRCFKALQDIRWFISKTEAS